MAAGIETRLDPVELMVCDDQLRLNKPGNRYDILTTDRLLLRPLVDADADSLHPALSDREAMKYWSGVAETLDETQRYLRYNIDPDGADCFAITRKESPCVALGWVILMDRRPAIAELGYLLVPSAQGAGLAREAVACALDYGFTTRGYRRIYADTDPENDRSIALLEALGFVLEGRHRATWETHIGIRDSAIYALLNPQS
ncbi:MAG: ribosomal-protein-alanine N-acetyltransferase [Myxococcota bacterium]|jgi:ribosomal-protein-alanine N-acetyltransferase